MVIGGKNIEYNSELLRYSIFRELDLLLSSFIGIIVREIKKIIVFHWPNFRFAFSQLQFACVS